MKRFANLSILFLFTLTVSCGIVEPENMDGSLTEEPMPYSPVASISSEDGMAKQIDDPEQLDEHPVFALPIKPNITK